jgi:hypothetical protein
MTQKWSNTGPNPSPDRGALWAGRGCRGCGQRVTGCQPLPQNVIRKQMAADERR